MSDLVGKLNCWFSQAAHIVLFYFIGRNGETIRQMSRASKTKIYIDRTQDDYRDKPRVITISGAKPQIEIAKVTTIIMITVCLCEYLTT